MTTYFIGIDPGLTGAIGVLDATGKAIDVIDTPIIQDGGKAHYDMRDCWETLHELHVDCAGDFGVAFVAIEYQQAFPKQGGVGNFTLGMGLWNVAGHPGVHRHEA